MTYLWTHRWRLIECLAPMGILSKLIVYRHSKTAMAVFCWFASRAYYEGTWEEYRREGLL